MAHYTNTRDFYSDAHAIAGFYESSDDPEYSAGFFPDLTYGQAKEATLYAQRTFFPRDAACEWWGDFLYTIQWHIKRR